MKTPTFAEVDGLRSQRILQRVVSKTKEDRVLRKESWTTLKRKVK